MYSGSQHRALHNSSPVTRDACFPRAGILTAGVHRADQADEAEARIRLQWLKKRHPGRVMRTTMEELP